MTRLLRGVLVWVLVTMAASCSSTRVMTPPLVPQTTAANVRVYVAPTRGADEGSTPVLCADMTPQLQEVLLGRGFSVTLDPSTPYDLMLEVVSSAGTQYRAECQLVVRLMRGADLVWVGNTWRGTNGDGFPAGGGDCPGENISDAWGPYSAAERIGCRIVHDAQIARVIRELDDASRSSGGESATVSVTVSSEGD